MAEPLPEPEVVRCYFEDGFDPPVPAMWLRWPAESAACAKRVWTLPEGVRVIGGAPERFGFSVQRHGKDSYSVRLLWERTCFRWANLSRGQLLKSSLAPLLRAMGTDLWYLLDQPTEAESGGRLEAA